MFKKVWVYLSEILRISCYIRTTELLGNDSDVELLKAVAQKNTDAFKVFMVRFQERVYRTVFRFVPDPEVARDLVQDIFIKAYNAASSYSPDAELFTWLYRIIANHCINFLQKQKKDPIHRAEDVLDQQFSSLPDTEHAASQLSIMEKQERALAVRRALDGLPPRQRMAITLLRFEDLSYQEIAKTLDCSVSAVESLIFRGMETFKKILTRELER